MKITKNKAGNIVLNTASDTIIAVIPPGQYIHLSKVSNNVIHISDSAGPVSEINRITINSSEVTDAFGNPFSGDRDALVKLLSKNFSSGSGGGGLDPKAYDLADFKNQSSDTFVRKSDLGKNSGILSIASESTFVTVDNTDPKNLKLMNPQLKNADGDLAFNKQLVVNANGIIGTKSANEAVNSIKKNIVTLPGEVSLDGNDTVPYKIRLMTRVESDIRFIPGTSGNGSISASNVSYSTDKYVHIHEKSVYMSVFTHEGINPNTGLQKYRVDVMIPAAKALILSNKDITNDTLIKIQCENSGYKYELNGKIPAAIIKRIITENLK